MMNSHLLMAHFPTNSPISSSAPASTMYPYAFILLCFFGNFTAAIDDPTHLNGDVSINCGQSGVSVARDSREWTGDANPRLSSLLRIKGLSITSGVIRSLSSGDDPVPYGKARISSSKFSYEFQVNPGEKIVRLHFNSGPYKGFRRFKELFCVESGPFTLLGNFSASLTAHALGVNSFVKDFCLNVEENQSLSLIFTPATSQFFDAYAFVNGIEIISVPPTRSYFHVENVGVQMVGKSQVYVGYSTAFEMISRSNIRKDSVSPSVNNFVDSFAMSEKVPMQNANKINNGTWRVSVDVGFRYLVRLYFSRIGFERVEIGDFKIHINEMIDTVRERHGKNSNGWHKDFMVMMTGCKQEGKRDILIHLELSNELMDGHEPLEGFEVMKLSNPDNSLASPNPIPLARDLLYQTNKNLLQVLGQKHIVAFFAIAILFLVNVIIYISQQIWGDGVVEKENMPLVRSEKLCRRFSLAEIRLATGNFGDANFIGRGGFGKVYKGLIDNGKQAVAIKRLISNSSQGAREFLTEIETLTELRHTNLVSLIGFCSERREMILVYEYIAGGTLADHLYKLAWDRESNSSLTWKQRLNICIGAGRGLDYLHTGCSLTHRDVNTSNILLDKDFIPKVSDFGLAKYICKQNLESHVSTNVKGTFGYIDPYYLYTGKLTTKSDTYAFGVVLLELLSERPAVDFRVPEDQQILTKWAQENISQGKVEQIVAFNLRGEISAESLKTFVKVAESCLHENPKKRPTMAKIVIQLEFALEQQEGPKFPLNSDVEASVGRMQVASHSADVQKANVVSPPRSDRWTTVTTYIRSRFWPWNAVPKRQQQSKAVEVLVFSAFVQQGDLVFLENDDEITSLEMKIGGSRAAEVYKAVLPASGREIAIKKITRSPLSKMREVRSQINTVCQIKHSNILPILAHRWQPDCHYLVYGYMKNGSLQDYLQRVSDGRAELDWSLCYKIALGISAGLQYLHMKHIPRMMHRNLKPANILLDDEMEAQIADFGIGEAGPYAYTHLTNSTFTGTVGYIAPEFHQTLEFSDKCDVYSFGMVLGVLVTGKQPSDVFFENTIELGMVEWMRNAMSSVDPERAIDPRLLRNSYKVEEMIFVLKVACYCTLDDPDRRPNIREVRRILSQRSIPSQPFGTHSCSKLTREEIDMFFSRKDGVVRSLEMMLRISSTAPEFCKAVLPASGKEIAIKKITQYPPTKREEIRSQLNIICQIRHRNILPILGYWWRPDWHYFVYDIMKSVSLQDYLQCAAGGRKELDWLSRYEVALGVAAGLEHLHLYHDPCVFHRDLNPANIFLDNELVPRIAGLEVAVDVPHAFVHANCSCVIGAVGYIAPEYVQTSMFSDKCDVYSFGMILAVLVTGKQPLDEFFQNTTELSMVEWIRNAMCSEDPKQAIDPKLLGNKCEEQMIQVLRVACSCTLDDPIRRPNSREVTRMLSKIKEPLSYAINSIHA